jgi:type IV pilus assembly protein PilV
MLKPSTCRLRGRNRGVTMLEVLVTIVIITVGLLGAAGMQSRLQVAEVEAYQRAQAIVLLQEMVDRINANRKNAAAYVTAAPLGTASTLDCTAPATVARNDQCRWSERLLGATETTGGGATKRGAMNGARGCITNPVAAMPREVVVAVVWQGVTPTRAPGSTACGTGLYGDEKTRRAMIARVKVGCLQNDPTTGLCVTP